MIKEFQEEKHLLQHELMDTLHQEFLDIYNSADMASSRDILQKLILLETHTKKHFEEEEKLMDRINYPTQKEHKEEHAKVLAEMNYFITKSTNLFGRKMMKAYYLEKLPYWFDTHLISMDSDLASYNSKNEFNSEVNL